MWIRYDYDTNKIVSILCIRYIVIVSTEGLKRTDGRPVTEKPIIKRYWKWDCVKDGHRRTERSAGSLDSEILQQQQLWADYTENWKVRVQAGCAGGYHFSPHSSESMFNLIDRRTNGSIDKIHLYSIVYFCVL